MAASRPPRSALDADGLYARAVAALARRGRTQAELRRLLAPRAASPAALDQTLARLHDHGYLDDRRLADSAALFQKDVLLHGRARALRDLRTRGVEAQTAERAVAQTYAGATEDGLLRAYLKKKRLPRPVDLRRAAGLYRRLLTAGFTSAAIQRALRAWRLDPEWLDLLESAALDPAAPAED